MLRTVLKGNDALQYAMLTGIKRVAKENTPSGGLGLFSDLNNLKVFTVKDREYEEYFGFTKEETKKLLEYYDLEYNEKVKEMYAQRAGWCDGYHMGNVDIYATSAQGVIHGVSSIMQRIKY